MAMLSGSLRLLPLFVLSSSFTFFHRCSRQESLSVHKMQAEGDATVMKWAIIGLGDVVAVKSGPPFWKCDGSTLIGVMRRTPGAAQRWIEENEAKIPAEVASQIKGFDSIRAMMEDIGGDIDGVYIASPPGAHLDNVQEVVSCIDDGLANLKGVYIEKPCGRCAFETRSMAEELFQRNVPFFPAYVSRAHERTQVLRKLLMEDKVLGDKVLRVQYTQVGSSFARGLQDADKTIPWRLNAEYSGGGLILDMGCHILDRIDYLFGPISVKHREVHRKGGSSNSMYPSVEDYVRMTGTIGKCDWSSLDSDGATLECKWDFSPDYDERDELIITGESGSVGMAGMGAGLPIEIYDADNKLTRTLEFDNPEHSAQPLIQAVVNEMRNVDTALDGSLVRSPSKSANAVRTSDVLDSILGGYYGGRHDEFWKRESSWPGLDA